MKQFIIQAVYLAGAWFCLDRALERFAAGATGRGAIDFLCAGVWFYWWTQECE